MQQLSDAMIGTLKSWLSPEPQLGLVVLVVWLPLVSVLAYIALASALSAPVIFAIFIAPYAASLLFGPILGRLNQRLRVRVERIAYLMFVACVFAWMIKSLGTDSQFFSVDFTVKSVIIVTIFTALMKFAEYRAGKVDYGQR